MFELQQMAARIKSRAKDRNISMKDLLAGCNLGINAVSEMGKGKAMSSLAMGRIADKLDCSVDYLLGRTDEVKYNPSIDSLSDDEQELIDYFRRLGKIGRRHVLTFAENEIGIETEKGTGTATA